MGDPAKLLGLRKIQSGANKIQSFPAVEGPQILLHKIQDSIELNRNAKGEQSHSIKLGRYDGESDDNFVARIRRAEDNLLAPRERPLDLE